MISSELFSRIGFKPNNDGQLIRVPIPPLTGEEDNPWLQVRQYTEDARVRGRKLKEYMILKN